jgi:hypothetical protein
MNDYFTAKDISWANCVGIHTYRAAALTGCKKGHHVEVQKIGPHMNFTYCIKALALYDLEKLHCGMRGS